MVSGLLVFAFMLLSYHRVPKGSMTFDVAVTLIALFFIAFIVCAMSIIYSYAFSTFNPSYEQIPIPTH